MGEKLGNDASVRRRYAWVSAPLDKGHGVLAEVTHERLIDRSVCWIVYGQAVHGFEAIDVVCDVNDRQPQHVFGGVPALSSTSVLIEVSKF